MNEYNVKVNFKKGLIQTNLNKLVQNDYNSTKLNFTFDKEGRVLFKMLYPDGTQYVDEIINDSLVFGAGILHQEGNYEYEISLYTEDGRLTDQAIKKFEVRSELVNTDEIVEIDDRVPILDRLINEVNGLNNGGTGGTSVSEEIQVSSTMPTSGSVMLWYEIEGNSTVDLNNFFLENNENDLIINYQDDLDLNFELVNNELIVNNGVSDLDFTINEKKEMEVSYE